MDITPFIYNGNKRNKIIIIIISIIIKLLNLLSIYSNKYHGVYLRASNAIDLEKKGNNIVYKIWGGILNYVFFLGDGNPS